MLLPLYLLLNTNKNLQSINWKSSSLTIGHILTNDYHKKIYSRLYL
jgi:hypothetical protein